MLSSGVSQKPLIRYLSTLMSCGLLLELVDDRGGPGILFQHMRAAAWQRIAQPDADPVRLVEMNLVGRHVGKIGPVAPIDPDRPARRPCAAPAAIAVTAQSARDPAV